MGDGGLEGGQEAVQKIEKEGVGMNYAKLWALQVSKLAKMKVTAGVFIQHHSTVQPHTAIPRLIQLHSTRMDHHWAQEKQPAKPDYSSLAAFDCEIR